MNILLSADYIYYKHWAKNCIKSLQYYNPDIAITMVIAGKNKVDEIPNVRYYYDDVDISLLENPIAYYQSLRFLKVFDLFPNGELVMSIDCDTLCTEKFSTDRYRYITETIHVQHHHKKGRWMAGLVTYGNNNEFRKKYKEELLRFPMKNWKIGHDQKTLNRLAAEFKFGKLEVGDWMSFGRGKGTFLTLKGDQKISPGYLETYNEILKKIQ